MFSVNTINNNSKEIDRKKLVIPVITQSSKTKLKPNPLSQEQTYILSIPFNAFFGSQQSGKINELRKTLSQKLAENLTQSVGNTDIFTQILKDYENDECNDSCDNNLSITCSDRMIIDQVLPLLPRLDCATAKRRSEIDCVNVDISVDTDERNVSSKFSNKLNNKIILKPMTCNNSILDTTTKRTNDCSKNIDHSEIEPMPIELIKSYKTTNVVVVNHHVKEKEVVTSKINLSDIYGVFPTDFSPLDENDDR